MPSRRMRRALLKRIVLGGVVLLAFGVTLRMTACSRSYLPGDSAAQPAAGAPVLVVVAHQDDELGVIARMHRRIAEGHPVHVAWLTDNTFLSDSTTRQAESVCAMSSLGVPTSQLHFIGAELGLERFGSVMDALPAAAGRLDRLLREIDPAEIYVVAWEGGNLEHDATHMALVTALRTSESPARVYEFPLYNQAGHSFPWFQVLRLPAADDSQPTYADVPSWDEWRHLRTAIGCYASQAGIWWSVLAAANLC